MESNERYYHRRAIEERTAARRALSETARAWHAKLAQDFAERAERRHVSGLHTRRHRRLTLLVQTTTFHCFRRLSNEAVRPAVQ